MMNAFDRYRDAEDDAEYVRARAALAMAMHRYMKAVIARRNNRVARRAKTQARGKQGTRA
jgi:aminopeptidase-like protein